ncbi:MAG: ATP synthase F1 subunit delta [Oscillospiraceae bacterium]|nr:ATP synthase F1 subunit delta [Oscillospiraceae bacterium]
MAELSLRYGTALYDLAAEDGSLSQCLDQAVLVRDTLQKPECRQILEHPHISGREKRAFLQKLFPRPLHTHLNGFLSLLITKNRERISISALTAFIQLANRALGHMEAHVCSATALRDSQVLALQSVLSNKLGKQVSLSLEVDPALIGGISIYVDGHLIDRSVRKQIYDMRNRIKNGGGVG